MSSLSVELLFERFRSRGDLAALTQLFDEVAPELLPLALRLTGRRHDAEDLVQETFLVALEKRDEYDAARPLRPWLVGILVREARRLRRNAARTIEPDRLGAPAVPQPQAQAEEAELRSAVDQALSELPPKYSQLVSLHLFEGLAPREMSARLGIDAELVRTQLARGLEKLRRSLPASTTAAWTGAELGLVVGALRARVLARARSLPIQASAAGAGVLAIAAGLAASLCAVAALTAGALSLVRGTSSPSHALEAVELETGAVRSDAGDKLTVLETAEASAREPGALAEPASAAGLLRVRGRLSLPDGSPARSAKISLQGLPGSNERGEPNSLPKEWKNPEPVQTDAEGRFEFTLDPPRSLQWVAKAQLDTFVDVPFYWSDWTSDIDLGTETFERACSLAGTLTRKDGKQIGEHWFVSATPVSEPHGKYSGFLNPSGPVDAVSGRFRLDGLPAGASRLGLYSPLGPEVSKTDVTLAPGAPVLVDLVYDGPAPEHRVRVGFRHRWMSAVPMEGLQAELIDRNGNRKGTSRDGSATPFSVMFDDVDEGEYTLELKHPSFRTASKTGVRPGESVRLDLVGAAAIRLRVIDANDYALEHYAAELTLGTNHFPNQFRLANPAELSHEGRIFEGLPAGLAGVLDVTPAGLPASRLELPALTINEVRTIDVHISKALTLGVRVLRSDGKTSFPGVQLELTRGRIAGNPFGKGTIVHLNNDDCPARDAVLQSGSEGRAQFTGLALAEWTVRAHWSGWFNTDVVLDLAQPGSDELVIVQPAPAWVRGKILVADGADPAAQKLRVWPDHWTTRDVEHDFTITPEMISPDGSFRWGPFEPGMVEIFTARPASDEMGEFESMSSVARLQLEAGKETEVTLDLRRQLTAYLEIVASAGGQRIPRPFAQALPVDTKNFGALESAQGNPDGSVTLALAPGTKKRVALRGSGWIWSTPEEFTLAPGERLQRAFDVPLVQGRLRVVDAQTREPLRNKPVAWSMLLRAPSESAPQPGRTLMTSDGLGTTGPEGELDLVLPPGELLFAVRKDHEYFSQTPESARVPFVWTDKGPAETTIALPQR